MSEKQPVKDEALVGESPSLKYEREKWKLRELQLKLEKERYRKLQERAQSPRPSGDL